MRRFRAPFRALAAAVSVVLPLVVGAPASAQFPQSPVTIVVPFSAGSGTDTGARLLAAALAPRLGQPIVIDNRPGANGAIAAGFVSSAAPDGHTLLMGTNSTQSANPLMMRSLGYDPETDFAPIGMVGTFDGLLAVNPERLPFETAEEVIAHIRANPGTVSYATGSVTSLVNGAIFAHDLGLDMLQVPYRSSPEALTAVVGGEVDLMFPDIASALSFTRTGALKPLASITPGEVTPLAPDLTPLSQTLSPASRVVGWIGLFAPSGTPPETLDRLTAAVQEVVGSPDFENQLAGLGANAQFMPPADLAAFIDAERSSFAAIFEQVGVEPQ